MKRNGKAAELPERKVLNVTIRTVIVAVTTLLICTVLDRKMICGCSAWWLPIGELGGEHSSHHLAGWYTLNHVSHGLILYWLVWLFTRNRYITPGGRLTIAFAMEAVWELLENSPLVIGIYRSSTLHADYVGDSALNVLGDMYSCLLGAWMACRLPLWVPLVWLAGTELLMAWVIEDNLLLNVLTVLGMWSQ